VDGGGGGVPRMEINRAQMTPATGTSMAIAGTIADVTLS
jgi:hypothetical protein